MPAFTPEKKDIDRLLLLQNSDRGFFALALYSFMEAFLRSRYKKTYEEENSFFSLIDALYADLKNNSQVFNSKLRCLGELKRYRHVVNSVRHEFFQVSDEEAVSIVYRFREFALLNDFYTTERFAQFEKSINIWKNRQKPDTDADELTKAFQTIKDLQKKNSEAESRLADHESLKTEIKRLEEELARSQEDIQNRNKKVDVLRKEKFLTESEYRKRTGELEKSLASFQEELSYRQELLRLSCYTRTRFDYEQSLMALTSEQAKVLENITLQSDFLVQGSAGTGKSLVLIKALEKCLMEGQSRTVFLTFTRSLASYHKYVSSVLDFKVHEDCISTADSFLVTCFSAFTNRSEAITYDDKKLQELFVLPPDCPYSIEEVYDEVTNFIWANNVSREEYNNLTVERKGMKLVVKEEDRALLYDLAEQAELAMSQNHLWNRNCAALYLIHHASDIPESLKTDYALIDEAQDLPPCLLLLIKLLCRKTVILAGDADQSIYRNGFDWKRAGIDVGESRHILHTNFRNSIQIHSLAERYRKTIPGAQTDETTAFRPGPPPELFTSDKSSALHEKLIKRLQFFLEYLEYEPQNICIMTSKSELLKELSSLITEKLGVPSRLINAQQFDFSEQGIIRLSTMYSGKGLDFPVVFLLLDSVPRTNTAFDSQTQERLLRDLLYVSITRALEHLNVFCITGLESPAITDLLALLC